MVWFFSLGHEKIEKLTLKFVFFFLLLFWHKRTFPTENKRFHWAVCMDCYDEIAYLEISFQLYSWFDILVKKSISDELETTLFGIRIPTMDEQIGNDDELLHNKTQLYIYIPTKSNNQKKYLQRTRKKCTHLQWWCMVTNFTVSVSWFFLLLLLVDINYGRKKGAN